MLVKFRMSSMRSRHNPHPLLPFFECVRLSVSVNWKLNVDLSTNRAAVNLSRDFYNQMTDLWQDYDVCEVGWFRAAVL